MTTFKPMVSLILGLAALLFIKETGAAQEKPVPEKQRSGDFLNSSDGGGVRIEPSEDGQEKEKPRPGRGFGGVKLKVGQVAPDFELLPLEFEKNEMGEMVGKIGMKRVKLSAYKGKAPVCIFSSSYT